MVVYILCECAIWPCMYLLERAQPVEQASLKRLERLAPRPPGPQLLHTYIYIVYGREDILHGHIDILYGCIRPNVFMLYGRTSLSARRPWSKPASSAWSASPPEPRAYY